MANASCFIVSHFVAEYYLYITQATYRRHTLKVSKSPRKKRSENGDITKDQNITMEDQSNVRRSPHPSVIPPMWIKNTRSDSVSQPLPNRLLLAYIIGKST